jgi:hypothetical protein
MKRLGRRGKSLVETLVVIAAMSTALAVSTMTLATLFRTERQLRLDREQQLACSKLAELWRADAHSAVDWRAAADCQFTIADGREIHYYVKGERLWREVRRGTATLHRDSFPLSAQASAAFAAEQRESRVFAVLSVKATSADRRPGAPLRNITISAVVNLHGAPAVEAPQP